MSDFNDEGEIFVLGVATGVPTIKQHKHKRSVYSLCNPPQICYMLYVLRMHIFSVAFDFFVCIFS